MKILLLNRSYYPNIGGIENSLYYLSREYKGMGHEVSILTENKGNYLGREEYADIITYPRYNMNKLLLLVSPLVYKSKITEWIRKNKQLVEADLIISRDPMLGLAYSEVFPEADIVYIPAVVIKYYNKGGYSVSSSGADCKSVASARVVQLHPLPPYAGVAELA